MVLKRGYVTLLYTVRYDSHTVHRSNYAVLAVRCKFQDSVFLRLTVRCDTVRYGNLLQYYNTVYTTGYTATGDNKKQEQEPELMSVQNMMDPGPLPQGLPVLTLLPQDDEIVRLRPANTE